jgi:ubiquinone/menaquinone biosynthesis C-methylase UbiE
VEMHAFEKRVVNALSRHYLRWFVLPQFQRLLDVPLRGHGLALGPGVGWEVFALAQRYPDATVMGVDYDIDQVMRARRNLGARPAVRARVAFHRGDATALACPEETFDFAYELNVLHHIVDYPQALREVYRVLRPGAPFFLQDLSSAFFWPVLRRLFPPESLFTRAELASQLAAAGFRVEVATGRAVVFLRARRP